MTTIVPIRLIKVLSGLIAQVLHISRGKIDAQLVSGSAQNPEPSDMCAHTH